MSRDFRAGLILGVVLTILGICAVGQMAKIWAQTSLTFSVGSYHFDRSKNYCEVNPGVFAAHQFTETLKGIAGLYKNSDCQTSVVPLGVIYEPLYLRFGNWRAGTLAAVATGYGDSTFTAVGGATVLIPGPNDLSFRLLFIPAASKGVLALFVEKRW